MVTPPILDNKSIPSPSVFPFGQSCFGRGDRAGEREAAALYAFARAVGVRLLCLAMLQTPWGSRATILKRASETAPATRLRCWIPSSARWPKIEKDIISQAATA